MLWSFSLIKLLLAEKHAITVFSISIRDMWAVVCLMSFAEQSTVDGSWLRWPISSPGPAGTQWSRNLWLPESRRSSLFCWSLTMTPDYDTSMSYFEPTKSDFQDNRVGDSAISAFFAWLIFQGLKNDLGEFKDRIGGQNFRQIILLYILSLRTMLEILKAK